MELLDYYTSSIYHGQVPGTHGTHYSLNGYASPCRITFAHHTVARPTIHPALSPTAEPSSNNTLTHPFGKRLAHNLHQAHRENMEQMQSPTKIGFIALSP
jgi:hypothetical protein